MCFLQVFVEDHHSGWDHGPPADAVYVGIEQHGFDAFAFEIKPREVGFYAVVEPSCFDDICHQGTTSPAASSSGRGARPSIALRCGKRPKRAMISRCFFA